MSAHQWQSAMLVVELPNEFVLMTGLKQNAVFFQPGLNQACDVDRNIAVSYRAFTHGKRRNKQNNISNYNSAATSHSTYQKNNFTKLYKF